MHHQRPYGLTNYACAKVHPNWLARNYAALSFAVLPVELAVIFGLLFI